MTDDQWLKAIAKHSGSRVTWSSFTGGAEELAHVLKAEAARQPERCARLALRLDASSHPAYLNGILQGLNETQEDLPPELVFDAIRHAASLDRPDHDRWIPYALHGRYDQDIPDDIIELILDKTLNSPDPSDDAWQRGGSPGQRLYGGDPLANGINTARGAGALALGDLLVHDADGHRTALVEPSFEALAADPSVAVRSCIAHVLAAGLRHARESAVAAVATLIDAPDALLATRLVDDLIVYVGFGDSARVEPIITRMISSELAETRESGGRLAAFAGLELELPDLLSDAVGSADVRTRMGAAAVCAQRVPVTADVAAATGALDVLMEDRESEVREAAAAVAGALRNHPLAPNRPLIGRLIASSAFDRALFQLLITLDEATERVDDLVLATARRFLDLHGGELSSMATRAAGESREIGQLVLRAYVQAPDAAGRAAALDLIDELLTKAAYGLDEQVGDAER